MEEIRSINFKPSASYPKNTQETSQKGEIVPLSDAEIKMYSKAKTSEIISKIKLDDLKQLEQIKEYNKQIRQKPKTLSLDRNPLFQCDIPYQPNSFYRMIGEEGYQDFLNTDIIRPKQNTKQDYQEIYFEKGRANNINERKGGCIYILETNSKRVRESENHYPSADMLEKDKDSFRIWHRTPSGSYEIVYDTMGDVISRNPSFRFEEVDAA